MQPISYRLCLAQGFGSADCVQRDRYIVYIVTQSAEANPKATRVAFGASKKTITHVRGFQMLSNSRIMLYCRGASFNLTLSKLVNSPFNLRRTKDFWTIQEHFSVMSKNKNLDLNSIFVQKVT